MRFMMLIIAQDPAPSAPDPTRGAEAVAKLTDYNKTLQKAGVLLAFDGLFPPSTAARIAHAAGKPQVTGGPFAAAKETIAGYWIVQVRSREEAIEWARRAPLPNNEVIEVRQLCEIPAAYVQTFEPRNVVA